LKDGVFAFCIAVFDARLHLVKIVFDFDDILGEFLNPLCVDDDNRINVRGFGIDAFVHNLRNVITLGLLLCGLIDCIPIYKNTYHRKNT
jgi:hypothetical protein